MNQTTLEIGQGASTFRGFIGLPTLLAGVVGLGLLVVNGWILIQAGIGAVVAEVGLPVLLLGLGVLVPAVLVGSLFALSAAANDYFGFIDAPVRLDRARRKLYVWVHRAAGPVELSWDDVKPVAQSASAPPYQVNSFRSVLLVDEDAQGEVRFEGRTPRIAQVGAAVLDRAYTLAAYEFVRIFMEHGVDALPPVREHLVWRRGARSFVDIFGFLKDSIRDWPTRPDKQRSLPWLVAGVVAMTIAAPLLWPFQVSQGIAQRTTRLPIWPQSYEELATSEGDLFPPRGSLPNDPSLRPLERFVATLWVASACSAYGLLGWNLLR